MTKETSYLSKNDTIGAADRPPSFPGIRTSAAAVERQNGSRSTVFKDCQIVAVPQSCGRGYSRSSAQSDDRLFQRRCELYFMIFIRKKRKPGILRKGKPACSAFLAEPARLLR